MIADSIPPMTVAAMVYANDVDMSALTMCETFDVETAAMNAHRTGYGDATKVARLLETLNSILMKFTTDEVLEFSEGLADVDAYTTQLHEGRH